MHILSLFGKKEQRSTKISGKLRPTMAEVPPVCTHSGLTAEDWLDLQALAQGKFLPHDPQQTHFGLGLINWRVEINTDMERAALARLAERGFALAIGPEHRFACLTMPGVVAMEHAIRHAKVLHLARV
jgi:hypothetical protein